jgi:hypothetical protein
VLMTTLAVAALVAVLAFVITLAALLTKGAVHVSFTIWKFLQFTLSADPKLHNTNAVKVPPP